MNNSSTEVTKLFKEKYKCNNHKKEKASNLEAFSFLKQMILFFIEIDDL